MWYAGELATCHRVGFTKYYDLAERIFPAHLRDRMVPDDGQVDWLCRVALDRMGFGTPGDIQRFWDAMNAREVRAWLEGTQAVELQQVQVQTAAGDWFGALAPPDIETRLERLSPPTARLRILNPFDPVIRDRARLERLFGFTYRVEMFVPAARRVWGYYVFPILEGDRFVGRIEVRADRKTGELRVLNLWREGKIAWTAARDSRLDAELERMRRFIGLDRVLRDA
jgi:hypothetical protein